jgi:hypothetical protein
MPSKLLIMIGPQGAGNHLFSKVFAGSPRIGGWKALTGTYWKGHHTEPFADVWAGHRKLTADMFHGYDFWVTSCSIPFICNGDPAIPNVNDIVKQAQALGVEVELAMITRDTTILELQQTRVRGAATIANFYKTLKSLAIPYHVFSHESLLLLKQDYVNYITRLVGFPKVALDPTIIQDNANAKYIQHIDSHWLDAEVQKACDESKQ